MEDLIKFKKDVTSQWGEDGIIEEIFNRIGTDSKICVEFGAWDGKYLSNTWNLWHEKDWSAILIESNKDRVENLKEDTKNFNKVTTYCAFVKAEGENSLDNILGKLNIDKKIDLISIDIDSDEYYILQSLKKYLPRVLIVEYNPTIPPEFDIVQEPGEYFGSSAKAITRLAKEKGYTLVAVTGTNCFYVANEEFPKLKINPPRLQDIFAYDHICYVITSFDGKPLINKVPPYMNIENAEYNKITPKYISEQKLIPIYLKKNEPLILIVIKTIKIKLRALIKKTFFLNIYKKFKKPN